MEHYEIYSTHKVKLDQFGPLLQSIETPKTWFHCGSNLWDEPVVTLNQLNENTATGIYCKYLKIKVNTQPSETEFHPDCFSKPRTKCQLLGIHNVEAKEKTIKPKEKQKWRLTVFEAISRWWFKVFQSKASSSQQLLLCSAHILRVAERKTCSSTPPCGLRPSLHPSITLMCQWRATSAVTQHTSITNRSMIVGGWQKSRAHRKNLAWI